MHKKKRHVTIISGEHSGDIYAADLVEGLCNRDSNVLVDGISGPLAQAKGLQAWTDCNPERVMFFWDALFKIYHYKMLLNRIRDRLTQQPPDLLILIDYAGLNLRIAQLAHPLGIKILYYIPPKVWAWGQSRLKKIRRYCDVVAPIYPFEYDFFVKHQLTTMLARHTFIDKIPTVHGARQQNLIVLLPGSRPQEIRACLAPMLEACQRLLHTNPTLKFKLLCAESNLLPLIQTIIASESPAFTIPIVTSAQHQTLQTAQVAIVCSGTATFECGMLGVPMVVIAREHWFNYSMIKLLVKTRWFSLPNLILNRQAVPELIQSQCCPNLISEQVSKIVTDSAERYQQISDLEAMQSRILNHPQSALIEDIALRMLATNT